jgi:hypothetical protein
MAAAARCAFALPPAAAACCALALALAAAPCSAGEELEQLAQTPEWSRLARLWHAMLDHSSGQLYNPEMFGRLGSDLDRADADLDALVERRRLGAEAAGELRDILHRRHHYLGTFHYTTQSRISVSRGESADRTAQWIVEFELAVLCRRVRSQADSDLLSAAKSNIAYQLTFLRHLDEFEAESDRRRRKLRAREEAGEEVDFDAFEVEYQKRLHLLLQAYRDHRLPRVSSVDRAVPYVFALTAARPTGRDPSSDLADGAF